MLDALVAPECVGAFELGTLRRLIVIERLLDGRLISGMIWTNATTTTAVQSASVS